MLAVHRELAAPVASLVMLLLIEGTAKTLQAAVFAGKAELTAACLRVQAVDADT
jgi:hypothetical protein